MLQRTTLIAFLASAVIGIALFALKYQVRDLENELTGINRTIIGHREAIHVLNAEWGHLNDPDRVAALATRLLQLQPTTPERIGSFASLPLPGEAPAVVPAAPVPGKNPPPSAKRAPAIAQIDKGADHVASGFADAPADGRIVQ